MPTRHGTHVILKNISPSVSSASADKLVYPDLKSSTKYFDYPSLLLRNSVELIKHYKSYRDSEAREEMQVATLLMAAHRLQSAWFPPMKLFWSAQLTTRSVALFGQPLSREVSRIAVDELRFFESVAERFKARREFFEPLLSAYRSLVMRHHDKTLSIETRFADVLGEVGAYFNERYADVFACFDAYTATTKLSAQDIRTCFSDALRVLRQGDTSWKGWEVITDDSARLSVDVFARRIVVGRHRSPVLAQDVRGLFAHEVLVHALRAVHGGQQNEELGHGLPGYLVAEEGLGVVVESAVNGKINHKIIDRYVDIALAIGAPLRRPLSRSELFEICYGREVTRGLAADEEIDLGEIEKKVWEHVNRIYRGSLGNRYIGVFTKDVSYYKGFVKMGQYLQEQLRAKPIRDIMEFVLQGKFDPLKATHLQKIKRK